MPALIYDFDGVIADSEVLANLVLAEELTKLGSPTTLEDALSRYSGRRWSEAMEEIERDLGRPAPDDFSIKLQETTLERFRADLHEVEGAGEFVRKFSDVPHCIASSSSMRRLRPSLDVLSLRSEFEGKIFSADDVPRGKPHPDIFLFAAGQLGVSPAECLVIEDSINGVKAAVAAGMSSLGLCAASHIRPSHMTRLREAGAAHLASSWIEAAEIATSFLGGPF